MTLRERDAGGQENQSGPQPQIIPYLNLINATLGEAPLNPDWVPSERYPELQAGINQVLQRVYEDGQPVLTGRERRVLQLRTGIEGGQAQTLEEVGREFEVTRERIRQIEAKALRKLRHPSSSRIIAGYISLSPLSLGRQVWGAVFVKDLPEMEGFDFDLNLGEEAGSFLPGRKNNVPLYLHELLRKNVEDIPDDIKQQIKAEFERASDEIRQKREQEEQIKKQAEATALRTRVLRNNHLLAGFDIDPDRLVELAQRPLGTIYLPFRNYLCRHLKPFGGDASIGDLLTMSRQELAKVPGFGNGNLGNVGEELERLLQGQTGYLPGFLGVFFMMHSFRSLEAPGLPKPDDMTEEEPENVLLPEINLSPELLDSLKDQMLADMKQSYQALSIAYRELWNAGIYTIGNLLVCTRQELFTGVPTLKARSVKILGNDLDNALGYSGRPVYKIADLLIEDYARYHPRSYFHKA